MTYVGIVNDDYLEHHGVKGMKWGVRRSRKSGYRGWRDRKNWHGPTTASVKRAAHLAAHPFKYNPYYANKRKAHLQKQLEQHSDSVKQLQQWLVDNPDATGRKRVAVETALQASKESLAEIKRKMKG